MADHIVNIIRRCFCDLRQLRSILWSLSLSTLCRQTFAAVFIDSRGAYCIVTPFYAAARLYRSHVLIADGAERCRSPTRLSPGRKYEGPVPRTQSKVAAATLNTIRRGVAMSRRTGVMRSIKRHLYTGCPYKFSRVHECDIRHSGNRSEARRHIILQPPSQFISECKTVVTC